MCDVIIFFFSVLLKGLLFTEISLGLLITLPPSYFRVKFLLFGGCVGVVFGVFFVFLFFF